MTDPKKKKPFPPKKEDSEAEELEEEDPEEEEPEAEKGFPQKKKKGFPPKKKDDFDKEFADACSARIKELMVGGMNEDDAVKQAYKDCSDRFKKKDSVARLSRQGVYYYLVDGQWEAVIKDFPELQKAVDKLGGKPLPTFAHHEDAGDPSKLTGMYYRIIADDTTKAIYGKTYPDYPTGTQNSIGFWCDEIVDASGIKHQVNIDLDHVAVSADLVGRGGETVAVIDMADPDMKKQLDEATAAVKAKGDEIAALDVKIKESDSKIKAKDAEIEILKAKSASVGDEVKLLKERLDAIIKEAEQKEKCEVIASILDPKRRLGDERTKALKATLDTLDLKGVKALKVQSDIFAPITDGAQNDYTGLFPPTGEKSPALDDMFKDERHEYHGNKM